MQVRDGVLNPRGYQQFVATSLATPQALTVPERAKYALLKCTAQSVRWKDDTGLPGATAVSATSGMLLDVGDEFMYTGQLKAVRVIETAVSAVLDISYYE